MNKLIAITLLLINGYTFAQKKELGKVTIEELTERVCPSDSSASAAVLFNIGKTYFEYSGEDGFSIVTEVDTKIKIYKKEGYSHANHSERYYIGGRGNEKVVFTKANTYNLVNGKIEKSKLGSDGEFDEKVNKFWSKKKITMPNVREGSIIEFKMTITSPYISNFPDWEFQKDIPVNFSEYTTYIPEYHLYNTHSKGFFPLTTQRDTKERSIDYTYIKNGVPGMTSAKLTERIRNTISFKEAVTKYSLTNVTALKDESYTNNINNYKATIVHELAGTRYPNSSVENFSTDWESITRSIYKSEKFGDELKKTGYFEKDLDALLSGVSSQEDRVTAVFNHVKSRMNWDEFSSFFCDQGVKKAYQDKKGNVAEINLMLTAMLRYAGIEANPILISTRSNGIAIFPSQSAFNYVICGVELPNQVILLDATNKFALPNILPLRDLNWSGRIIRKNESSAEVNLLPAFSSKDILNILAVINADGSITGKIRDQYFDYNAFVFRNNNYGVTKESHIEKLEKKYQGLEIEEYEVLNSSDFAKPIVENYSFTSSNSSEIIGNKIYVSPFMFFTMTENPFKQETREYPVDFIYPSQNKYNISFTIPEGYVVESLPQPKALAMPDEIGNFKYNISNTGKQIQIIYSYDLNQAVINAEYYEVLKNFYKEIVNKQTEKIVLKKA